MFRVIGFGMGNFLVFRGLGQNYLYRMMQDFVYSLRPTLHGFVLRNLACTYPRAENVRKLCFEAHGTGETLFPIRQSTRHYQSNKPSSRLD